MECFYDDDISLGSPYGFSYINLVVVSMVNMHKELSQLDIAMENLKKEDGFPTWLFLIIVAIILGLSFLWMKWQWELCRDMGASFWYCVKHIL